MEGEGQCWSCRAIGAAWLCVWWRAGSPRVGDGPRCGFGPRPWRVGWGLCWPGISLLTAPWKVKGGGTCHV